MLNTPRFNATSIHQRLSRQLSAITKESVKPSIDILAGSSRFNGEIVEANGFDVQVGLKSPLVLRQRVVVMFRSNIPSLDVAIPGIVHWLDTRSIPPQAGIALQEQIPEELTVRQPGCVRNNIRYSCKIHGSLSWNEVNPETRSGCIDIKAAATAMNYSRDGFCVQLNTEPAIGTSVVFAWQNERSLLKISGLVRWVIGQSGGALAGCESIDSKGYMLGSGFDV